MRPRTPVRWPYSKDLYKRAIAFAEGYDRLKAEAMDLLMQSSAPDGQPRGTGTSDPTAAAAIRRERVMNEIHIIETAILDVEPEYRQVVITSVCRGVPLNHINGADYTSIRTWVRQRQKFLLGIVREAGWGEADE